MPCARFDAESGHGHISLRSPSKRDARARERLLGGDAGRDGLEFLGLLDAGGFALAPTEIIQLGAPDASLADDFNRADHRRVHGKNPFDANAEADAPHREAFAKKRAAPVYHDAFEGLDTFFFAFTFF